MKVEINISQPNISNSRPPLKVSYSAIVLSSIPGPRISKMERNAVSEEEFFIDAIYKDGYFLSDKKAATRGVL